MLGASVLLSTCAGFFPAVGCDVSCATDRFLIGACEMALTGPGMPSISSFVRCDRFLTDTDEACNSCHMIVQAVCVMR